MITVRMYIRYGHRSGFTLRIRDLDGELCHTRYPRNMIEELIITLSRGVQLKFTKTTKGFTDEVQVGTFGGHHMQLDFLRVDIHPKHPDWVNPNPPETEIAQHKVGTSPLCYLVTSPKTGNHE